MENPSNPETPTQMVEDDIIPSLLNESPFKIRPDDEKLVIIQKGRPVPSLFIVKRDSTRNCNRTFQSSWYVIHKWLCGSKQYNKLFCWPCTLMRPESSSWCSTGNDDMKRLSSMASKHSVCKSHLKAVNEYDATLIGYGMLPEFGNESRNENKEKQETMDESDSEDYFDLYFTDDQKSRKRDGGITSKTNLKSNSNDTTNSSEDKNIGTKRQISFKDWQEMYRQSHSLSKNYLDDRRLFKWKKKIARQELKNARLTGQKIKIEIELLRAKMNFIKPKEGSGKVAQDESSMNLPVIVPIETMRSITIEDTEV